MYVHTRSLTPSLSHTHIHTHTHTNTHEHTHTQVTLTIGRKILATKPVARARNGMFEFSFFEAMEMEDDYAYDDTMWPWHDHDYEEGYFPSDLIDLAVPVCWLNVYKCGAVSSAVGLGDLTKTLIGFKKMTLRELLGIGPREREATSDLECGKPIFAEQVVKTLVVKTLVVKTLVVKTSDLECGKPIFAEQVSNHEKRA